MSVKFEQIKTGRVDTITLITNDTINRLARVQLFELPRRRDVGYPSWMFNKQLLTELNNDLYLKHKELMRVSMCKNNSLEVGMVWNFKNNEYCFIHGNKTGVSISDSNRAMELMAKSEPQSLFLYIIIQETHIFLEQI